MSGYHTVPGEDVEIEIIRKEQFYGDWIFVLHDFLSPEECREFIALGEAQGFADAPITTGRGFEMRKDIRNNTRVIHDDRSLAASLWERAAEGVVPLWNGRQAIGLNERFRFYRYEPGQRFARHFDGRFERENGEQSEFSFLIYLNDDFDGGNTVFFRPQRIEIRPTMGSVLVFQHHQSHEGAVVERGVKYVLRSDVMYSAPQMS